MYEQINMSKENKSRTVANSVAQKKDHGNQVFGFEDKRPEAVIQKKTQTFANNYSTSQLIQKKENKTGLPDNLKTGIENLSGYSMEDVKVHYNSDKPAQLQAHAYVQGANIHLGSGQEKHLPHEAWHVVQQKQGRVKPTIQLKVSTPLNDDPRLEKEADIMAKKALQIGNKTATVQKHAQGLISQCSNAPQQSIQRKVGFEFQTNWEIIPDPYGAVEGFASAVATDYAKTLGMEQPELIGFLIGRLSRAPISILNMGTEKVIDWVSWGLGKLGSHGQSLIESGQQLKAKVRPALLKTVVKGVPLIKGMGWEMSSDEGEMEFVTDAFEEGDYTGLKSAMQEINNFNLSLLSMQNRRYIPINWFDGVTIPGHLAAVVPKGNTIVGMPQMTAGIDLNQLYNMIHSMGTIANTRSNTTRDRGGTLGLLATRLPGGLDRFSPEYKGLVTLMASYVVQSALLPTAIEKDIATIMARTNFGMAFRQTPEYRRRNRKARGIQSLKDQLAHYVIESARRTVAGFENSLVVNPIAGEMRMFPGSSPDNRTGPTLRGWTNGIVEGRDLMAAGYTRFSSRSMGALNKMEPVGTRKKKPMGMIAEFRNLPGNIPYTEWKDRAKNWMSWIMVVNNRRVIKKNHP